MTTSLPDLSKPVPSRWQRSGPSLIALGCLILILATSQTGLFGLKTGEAPGLTLDEGFNVAMGVYLVRSVLHEGLGNLHPDAIREIWGSVDYNPDHPPLGRWALGIVHELFPPDGPVPFSDFAARPASAIAFALTVWLIGRSIQNWYGPLAGCVSALVVALLPRQFAHAHLASLETMVSLMYVWCLLYTAEHCRPETARGYRPFVWAGALWGLALLTKIQAIFLAPAVGRWALTQWKWQAIPRMAVFGVAGFVVFFAGWPWLWLDPAGHLVEYFARTTERQTLYCYYLGERYADHLVPWHYPWVMFVVTVPLGMQLLSVCGLLQRKPSEVKAEAETSEQVSRSPFRLDSRLQLLLWGILIPLLAFSLPNARKYDGERLFCVVFPLWAAFAGPGVALLSRASFRIPKPMVIWLTGIVLATQVYGNWLMNPCQLSFYSLIVGGPTGADQLGFERSYWMEGLTEDFQRQIVANVPAGSRIDVAPVLHPVYLPHLLRQSPILQQAGITLAPYDDKQPGGSKYVLHFHRRADPWASLSPPPAETKVLAELKRATIPLLSLYQLP